MITLPGKSIYLRALEPNDLDFVYDIENDQSIWHVSNTNTPYSKFLIKQYLANAQQDIFEAKQLRLAICLNATFEAIGLIDLFDFDPNHRRGGIGIVIANQQMRNLNFGTEALEVLIHYSFTQLQLHQLYANISTINTNSIALFTKFGFQLVGIKKEWMYLNNSYQDEAFFQLINPQQ
jgi:diamine N-acetyltransferase